MKSTFFGLAALAVMATIPAYAVDAQGYWTGSIANHVSVIVHLNKASDGRWEGKLSVPKQGMEAKVEKLVVTPDQISFALADINASYTARWNANEKAWTGTWSQGQSAALILKRADANALEALKLKRPQEDAIAAGTPSYSSSEVSFASDAGKVTLAGTFTIPQGKGPFPAVVLIHGSGPINRDENIHGHKLFLVLADHLSRQGIAVLRYDKRGVAKSTGTYGTATSFDLATDAEAAVRFLRGRAEVDTRHIGIVGHSEGGLIAPLVASRDPALGFVVLLAGPGVRGELLMVEQLALSSKANGASDEVVAAERAFNQLLFAALAGEAQLEAARSKATQVLDDAKRKGTLVASMSKSRLEQFTTPWFHAFLRHEPGPALQATRQPILVLNGELDRQVPAAMDLDAIRIALKGNARAVVKELPKLNHLFQTATTGSSAEYIEIEETMAQVVLDTVSEWIRATVR